MRLTLAIHNLGLETNENVHGVKDIQKATRDKANLERLEKEKQSVQVWLSVRDILTLSYIVSSWSEDTSSGHSIVFSK